MSGFRPAPDDLADRQYSDPTTRSITAADTALHDVAQAVANGDHTAVLAAIRNQPQRLGQLTLSAFALAWDLAQQFEDPTAALMAAVERAAGIAAGEAT
ncbi:MAG: hypothetical protein ABS81_07435 [Pseudonocardia sp. SCN 72-86]|nr:MAG: hypothetical protein ABS81_07435 [Pseudonocardia sp. SCN 72-86]